MKLILDEGMPLRTAAALRAKGVDAQHVLELEMGGASDEAILSKAAAGGAFVATLDSDFHQVLALTQAKGPSVIRIRIEGLKGPQLAAIIADVLAHARADLEAGAALSVDAKRIRSRRLPIRR